MESAKMGRIIATVILTACLLSGQAVASPNQERIVAQLAEQGFTRIEVTRTLLGRTRILAINEGFLREIVLNPRTGVILRDFWRELDGNDGPDSSILDPGNSGSGSSNSGSGSSNSGSGSSNSGSGSSNSGSGSSNSGSGSSNSGSGSSSSGSGSGSDDDD